MPSQDQFDSIPDVEDQTELDDPIKVDWTGDARHRTRTGFEAHLEDDEYQNAIPIRCFDRLKSKIVVKTEEELEGLIDELERLDSMSLWNGSVYNSMGHNAIGRVRHELEDE